MDGGSITYKMPFRCLLKKEMALIQNLKLKIDLTTLALRSAQSFLRRPKKNGLNSSAGYSSHPNVQRKWRDTTNVALRGLFTDRTNQRTSRSRGTRISLSAIGRGNDGQKGYEFMGLLVEIEEKKALPWSPC